MSEIGSSEIVSGGCCGGSAPRAHEAAAAPAGGTRRGLRWWSGLALLAGSTWLAWCAHTETALLWPVAAGTAWLGAYQTVAARGCGVGGRAARGPALPASGRATRRQLGNRFLWVTAGLSAVGLAGVPLVWPLAFVAGWFGVSFRVAARTGYAGCPEVGAIPSLLLGREIATRCPPLERVDARKAQPSGS
jgi:hypothetical protein